MMTAASWQTLAVALALASVHVFAGKLRFLNITPRSIWLSTAGGASVAYVFLHILPDLAERQEHFSDSAPQWLENIEQHVWVLALAGLAAFYGLEHLVRQSRGTESAEEDFKPPGVFWLHIGSFALYNLLFGYLLVRREGGTKEVALFGLAIGLHFMVNDFALRSEHRSRYHRVGRWVLALAILAGWAAGVWTNIHEIRVSALFAILAGGIILNVLKEELPEERRSRFWAFAAGATGYSALLLVAG